MISQHHTARPCPPDCNDPAPAPTLNLDGTLPSRSLAREMRQIPTSRQAELALAVLAAEGKGRADNAFKTHRTGERNGLRAAPHFLHHLVDTPTPA